MEATFVNRLFAIVILSEAHVAGQPWIAVSTRMTRMPANPTRRIQPKSRLPKKI